MHCLTLEPRFKSTVRKPENSQAVKVSGLTLDPCKCQMRTSQISHLLTQLMMTCQSLEVSHPLVHQEARRPQCPELLEMHDGRLVPVFRICANIDILLLCFDGTLHVRTGLQELLASCHEAGPTIAFDNCI